MNAFEATPILEDKITELEAIEPSWRNCRACPFSGKCCDGAPLEIFPEEKEAISDYLYRNPDILQYALSRFSQKEKCYFYDKESSKCLIHEVRPLLCRWTPYTAFFEDENRKRYRVHVRDGQCNFITKSIVPLQRVGYMISLSPEDINPGSNQTYLSWPDIPELKPLIDRAVEMVELDDLMLQLESDNPLIKS